MHLACFVNILILRNDMVTQTRISNKRYDFNIAFGDDTLVLSKVVSRSLMLHA